MSVQELFETAVAESKNLKERPDNATLLKMYSLYKQATEGDNTTEPPSNPFDIVNKAKYDAWMQLKGVDKIAAMQQYIDLINQLKGV